MIETIQPVRPRLTASPGWQLSKYAIYALLLCAALLILFGFVSEQLNIGGASNTAVDVENNTITLALTQEPPQMNSTKTTDAVSGMLLGHIMEGLIRYGPNNEILPGVAESWEMGELSGTFHLRKDAFWSDGTPVTAHDFVFAWKTALDPATASQYSFVLYPIKNGEAINVEDASLDSFGARAIDDYTLQIDLEQPTPYFIKLLAFFTYLPINEEFYESREGDYGLNAEDMIYNGPFLMSRWKHDQDVRLERNEHYWNSEATKLDAIEYTINSDPNTTLNLFATGKIVQATLNAENIERALNENWPIKNHNDGSVFYLGFNHREERPTSNLNLRKAIQQACDPEELVYQVLKTPGNIPGKSIFPVWLRGVNGYFRDEYPAPDHKRDIERAREYLRKALDELGLDDPPSLVFLTGDTARSTKHAEYYQSMLKEKLGIEIKIDQQIFKQRLAKMTAGEYDIVAAGWGPDYDDVLTFGDLFTSWNLNNRGLYKSEEVDRQVAIAQQSSDPATRMEAMNRVQHKLYEDAAIIFEFERGSVYVYDERVKGVARRSVGPDLDYTRAYISTKADH